MESTRQSSSRFKKAKKKRLKPYGSRRLCLFLYGFGSGDFAGPSVIAHDLYGLSIIVDRGGLKLSLQAPCQSTAGACGTGCKPARKQRTSIFAPPTGAPRVIKVHFHC
ncbi:hypothetical protein F0169_07265 [Pseudomonas sp. MAFF 212408]|uniref:Uncharacterized protein n=1 Tax=Pseudomonas kitaguniensis TaxID=2607908 RepID=A0A5N7KJK0_9PSED|nr:hypothetical protein [Pseudomonas kitaguniensis]MPR01895.1 hypothetical protein [Pseudomonas kitaguniensis]